MKAAVIYQRSEPPRYVEDFPDPVLQGKGKVLLSVKASAIKHLDKSKASGRHYTTPAGPVRPHVIGGDGVGLLADGTRVFALGDTGMLAEKAIVEEKNIMRLPDGIDNYTAAALPNAVAGSAMALRFRAAIKAGETVLINGATGFTGKIAVQVARHYGAKKIIVTGRNEQTLNSLSSYGADEVVPILLDDKNFLSSIRHHHHHTPVDIVIDYLWGSTAMRILEALNDKNAFTHRTRFVSVGAVTGDNIQLSSALLRSVDLQLSGSGLGSWTKEQMQELFKTIIPEMFQLVIEHKLKVDTLSVKLKDIESLWNTQIPDGKRLVVEI